MSEHFISGYCRKLDAPRMVEAESEAGEILEVDCCYGNCAFQTSCKIAEAIDELKE